MSQQKKDFSVLLKHEDYWAIWLGTFILLIGMIVFFANPPANMNEIIAESNATMQAEAERAPFKTIAWHEANEAKTNLKGSSTPLAKKFNSLFTRPSSWSGNPLNSLYLSPADAAAKREAAAPAYEEAKIATVEAYEAAVAAEQAAEAAGFQDSALNAEAEEKIDAWLSAKSAESKAKSAAETKPVNLFKSMFLLMIIIGLLFSVGMYFMGHSVKDYLLGFPVVFVLAVIAFMAASHTFSKAWGLEYVLWAVVIGLLIANTVGTPKIVQTAARTEYYIKTGLIMLGATILINKILLIGLPGIFITWGVTPVVLIWTFWFGQRILKIKSPSLNITVSADMSVSGVSAAIAAAAASKAKKEELTLAVGLSVAFTAVMMIVLPMFIVYAGLNPVIGGAWIGGTVDATGAVVAAGEIVGPVARDVAATIKMIQNILIGLMAFCVAAYFALVIEKNPDEADLSFKGAIREIWRRFPKFVLGFLGASIVFSIAYGAMGPDVAPVLIDNGISGFIGNLQRWLFCLAFISIGLTTNFRELFHLIKDGKPLALYLTGQFFNICLTILVICLMFYLVFPGIMETLMM